MTNVCYTVFLQGGQALRQPFAGIYQEELRGYEERKYREQTDGGGSDTGIWKKEIAGVCGVFL
jgi:hypothetical protein